MCEGAVYELGLEGESLEDARRVIRATDGLVIPTPMSVALLTERTWIWLRMQLSCFGDS